MNVTIAQRLATLRREHGLTQEQLAERIGVSRQAVSKWERTESSPDTDNLIALARLYGVTLDELLYGAGAGEGLGEEPEPAGDVAGAASALDGGSSLGAGKAPEATAAAGDPSSMASEATEAGAADGVPAGAQGDVAGAAGDDASSESDPENATSNATSNPQSNAEFRWDDGLRVDADDATVSVGWDGVVVDDHHSGDHVEVGPGGIHVDASDGKHAVRTEEDGSVWIDGTRYDSLADAHRVLGHHAKPRAFISRIPYAPVALIALVVLGLNGRWDLGGAFAVAIPAWEALCSVANARVRGQRGRKLRGAVAGLCFWTGLSAFLVTGLLTGVWHPTWVLVIVGVVAAILVDALWPRRGGEGSCA